MIIPTQRASEGCPTDPTPFPPQSKPKTITGWTVLTSKLVLVQSQLLQGLHSGNPERNWPAKSIVVQAQGYKRRKLGNL